MYFAVTRRKIEDGEEGVCEAKEEKLEAVKMEGLPSIAFYQMGRFPVTLYISRFLFVMAFMTLVLFTNYYIVALCYYAPLTYVIYTQTL